MFFLPKNNCFKWKAVTQTVLILTGYNATISHVRVSGQEFYINKGRREVRLPWSSDEGRSQSSSESNEALS